MSTLLKWVGGFWAVLGAGNLILSPAWRSSGSTMQVLVLMVNFVIFIIPGLALCGIGVAISRKPAKNS